MSLGSQTAKGDFRPERTDAEKAWIATELEEQVARYQKIVEEMEALTPQREKWVAEFLERIQTRGFHWHDSNKRVIPPEEIRPQDGRELRVVY